MSQTDEADYVFLKSDQGLVVCAECGEPCAEVGELRFCRRCNFYETPATMGAISAVLKRLPADHALLKQFEAEGLVELDAEEVAISIWEHITEEAQCRRTA